MPPDDLKPPTPKKKHATPRANIFLLVAGAVLVGVGVWPANAMIDARRPTIACRRAAAATRSKWRVAVCYLSIFTSRRWCLATPAVHTHL